MRLFLDLESLPSQAEDAQEQAAYRIKVPGNYSKPESIAKYIGENIEGEYRKTALDGGYGHLLCASYAFDDGPVETVSTMPKDEDGSEPFTLDAEHATLEALFGEIAVRVQDSRTPPMIVGHNVTWDLLFLWRRAVVLGLTGEYRSAMLPIAPTPTPWGGHIYDTQMAWTWERNKFIKLDELCSILGIDSPKVEVEGMVLDGSTVYDFWNGGYYQQIEEYNRRDVEAVREIYNRLEGNRWLGFH